MSWSRFFWLGDIGQQIDINEHEAQLKRLHRTLTHSARDAKQDERLQSLELEVMRLGAVVASLLELLAQKRMASDAEIAATIDKGLLAVQKAANDVAATAEAEGKKKVAEVVQRRRSGARRRSS